TDYDRYVAQRDIVNLFNAQRLSDERVAGLYIVSADDSVPVIASTTLNRTPDRAAMWDLPFVQQVLDLGGRVMWVPTMMNGLTQEYERPTIAVTRAVSVFTGTPAYLAVEIFADVLETPLLGVSTGEGSVTRLVAPLESGYRVVYSTEPEEVGEDYTYEIPEAGSSATLDIDGVSMLAVAEEVPLNGWRLVSNVPVAELVKDVASIRNV